MSRNLTRILMAVLVLNAIAVASSLLTNTAHSTANDAVYSTADDAIVATADFDYLFSTVAAAPYRIATPAQAAAVDFDKVFASVSAAHPMNTPPNRERLRNIGWRRILGS